MNGQELSPEDLDAFLQAETFRRLLYLWWLKAMGHANATDEITKLERAVYSDLAEARTKGEGSLSQRDVDELQVYLCTVEPQPKVSHLKALLFRLNFTTLKMQKESNHQRPHFHIEYKKEYRASYAIDNLEILVGNMPAKYENPILKWARMNQETLNRTWDRLQAGESIGQLTAEPYAV